MIKTITDDLHQFAEANASIGKLYKLFSKFLDLCVPLVQGNIDSSRSEQSAAAPSDMNMVQNPKSQAGPYPDMFGHAADQPRVGLHDAGCTGDISAAPQSVDGWDSLVWDLFDNQPSLDWAESELWKAMSHFDGAQDEY